MSFLLVSRSAAPYIRAFRPYGHLEQRVFKTLLQELASQSPPTERAYPALAKESQGLSGQSGHKSRACKAAASNLPNCPALFTDTALKLSNKAWFNAVPVADI